MLQDLKNWIEDIPAVTRYLVVSTFALSIGCMVGIATPGQLILDIPPIKENLQVYRLLTCHLLSGGQGLIWHLYMLYTNSRHLETSHFATRPGDYAFGVLLIIATLDVLGWYFQFIVLTEAFGMAITTLYSLIEGDKEVTFMFGARFKAKYLPWVMLVFVNWFNKGPCDGR